MFYPLIVLVLTAMLFSIFLGDNLSIFFIFRLTVTFDRNELKGMLSAFM